MERISEIFKGIASAVFTFIKGFFKDLFMALYFAAQEYDSTLQETKTTTYRVIFWSIIGIATVTLFFLLIYGIYYLISNLNIVNGL